MEATSLYLVEIELSLAFFGAILFFYQVFSKGHLLFKADINVAVLAVLSTLWLVLADTEGRWLGLKATLFVCCMYFSIKFPRQSMLCLALLAFMGFFIDNIAGGIYLSKHVGINANQILTVPFALIFCAIYLYQRKENINLSLLYFVVCLDIFSAFSIGARAAAISAILLICFVGSKKASNIFLKFAQWIPIFYIAIVLISYYSLMFEIEWMPATPSNIERSSMIFAAVSHFFEYPFTGPKEEFDQLSGQAIEIFDMALYDNLNGVDPHNFFLSLWRDEGSTLTLLWIFAWFQYWNTLRRLKLQLDETRVRVVIGMLAIAVVQFSLSPPSTGTRLLVALIMGTALGFAYQGSSVKANDLSNQKPKLENGVV